MSRIPPWRELFPYLVVAGILGGMGFCFRGPFPLPHGYAALPPSEFRDIVDQYPILRRLERDLSAGESNIENAVELVEPLIEGRLRDALAFRGKGIRTGVALMLQQWIEKRAEDDPE